VIANQGFYRFKQKLLNARRKYGMELREADPFYPPSKMCSFCGYVKKKLSLSERIFYCECCGNERNLMQANEYVALTRPAFKNVPLAIREFTPMKCHTKP
jgi:putative transposase